jgi:transcription elongation regulator 1
MMKKDKRMDLCEWLTREEMEKLFADHIEKLMSKKKERFRECLNEVKGLSLNSSWRDIRRQIKDDPRYLKFSESDRKCEREFREFLWDKLQAAKAEFKEFLKETKILSHKSKKLIDESDQHLQDIIAVLQNDQRYLVLDHFADERREILMAYVEHLHQKGPPPPPTASEPPAPRKPKTT